MAIKREDFGRIELQRNEFNIMIIDNNKISKNTLIKLGIIVCVLLTGCRDNAVDHYNRGVDHWQNHEYDQAVSEFTRAIQINPEYAEAYNSRGITYRDKNEYELAIEDYNKAIEINPQYAEAFNNRGNAYEGKGEYDQAISNYNTAIEINPEYAKAYSNRAITYYYKGEYNKAWDDIHMAQNLGYQIQPNFLKTLRDASGREN
jgi:tetratricopeptide (TPR) repeat protein